MSLARAQLLFAAAAAASMVACATLPPMPEKRSLDQHLNGVAGRIPEDCGELPVAASHADAQNVLQCVLGAVQAERVAVAVQHGLSVDSTIKFGLLSTPGELLFFAYDSAPCGGRRCGERFLTWTCIGPHVKEELPNLFVLACSRTESRLR